MIINYGDILKDQSGTILEKGDGACFLVISRNSVEPGIQEPEGPNQPEAKSETFLIMEIADSRGEPNGPIFTADTDDLKKLKYVGNLSKMVWEET